MGFFGDLSFLLVSSVTMLAVRQAHTLELTLITGLVLGGLCWWGCSCFSRLWNIRWQLKPVHHLLCGPAALLTFGTTLLFVSLSFTKDAALESIQLWQAQIIHDSLWQSDVFAKAYDMVKALGVAEIYTDAACKHFGHHRPFLSRMGWPPKSSVPRDIILSDVTAWCELTHENYTGTQAVTLASFLQGFFL